MAIVKIKSRGNEYYQVRKGNRVIKTLGSEVKILQVFQYFEETYPTGKHTDLK